MSRGGRNAVLHAGKSLRRALTTSGAPATKQKRHTDPRVREFLGERILDDYAQLRDHYATPKYPIVLAHGLLGFSELRFSTRLPSIQYWHGIKDALTMNGSTVYTTSVAPSSSIADRAAQLADGIIAEQQQQPQQRQSFDTTSSSSSSSSSSEPTTQPQPVNIIAHSLGGLDARYMISRLKHPAIRVASLTTIATPHRGSPVADYFVEKGAGPIYLPRLYGLIERTGLGTEAFEQLSTRFLTTEFNPATPDLAGVRYFSYGADIGGKPPLLSLFRFPHGLIARREGANDGLVSVESSRWGEYQGTLDGVGHLDLINWSNRMRWALKQWVGFRKTFNAVAFYLGIADMLAKEGC